MLAIQCDREGLLTFAEAQRADETDGLKDLLPLHMVPPPHLLGWLPPSAPSPQPLIIFSNVP